MNDAKELLRQRAVTDPRLVKLAQEQIPYGFIDGLAAAQQILNEAEERAAQWAREGDELETAVREVIRICRAAARGETSRGFAIGMIHKTAADILEQHGRPTETGCLEGC